jgi:hypothetical protein
MKAGGSDKGRGRVALLGDGATDSVNVLRYRGPAVLQALALSATVAVAKSAFCWCADYVTPAVTAMLQPAAMSSSHGFCGCWCSLMQLEGRGGAEHKGGEEGRGCCCQGWRHLILSEVGTVRWQRQGQPCC